MSSKTIVSLMLALGLTVVLSASVQAVSVSSVTTPTPANPDSALGIGDEVVVEVTAATTLADTAAAKTNLRVWLQAWKGAAGDSVIAASGNYVGSAPANALILISTTDSHVKIEKVSGYTYKWTFKLSALTQKWPPLGDQKLEICAFAQGATGGVVPSTAVRRFLFDAVRPAEVQDGTHASPVASTDYGILTFSDTTYFDPAPTDADTTLKRGDQIEVRADIISEAEARISFSPFFYGDVDSTVIWVSESADLTGKSAQVAIAQKDIAAKVVTVDDGWSAFDVLTKVYVYGFVRDKAGNLSGTPHTSQNPVGIPAPGYFYVDGKAPSLGDSTAMDLVYPTIYRGKTFGAFDGSKASDGTQPVTGYTGASVSGNVDNRLKISISEPGKLKITMGAASSVWDTTLAAGGVLTVDPFNETSGDSLTDGTYSVTVEAEDVAGNTASLAPITYTYDGTFPSFKDVYPIAGDTVGTSHVYLTLSEALDSLRIGFVGIGASLPGSPGATDSVYTTSGALTSLTEQTLAVTSTDSLPAGAYDLKLYAKDKVGNVTLQTIANVQVVTDYVVPTISEFNVTNVAPDADIAADSTAIGTEIKLTLNAWDAGRAKVARRYKTAGVTLTASDSVGVTFVGTGVTDNGDGTATLDASHWVNGVGKEIKVKSTVVYEGAPLIITAVDASGPYTGADTLYYFRKVFNKYLVTAPDTVIVGEPFDVIVTPTDASGNPSLKQGDDVYDAPYSEVWIAFTANKTDVALPAPQLITPLSTAKPQMATSVGPDTFQVTATAAAAGLVVTVRTTDIGGTTVQAWGSTSPIRVLSVEEAVVLKPPAGLKIMGGSTDVIDPDNVAAVIVSGYAAGVDSVQAKLLDKDGVEATSGWVLASAGNGYFSTTIDASALADGRVQYTARAALSGATSAWATTTEGIFPDVIKDTAVLDAPDTLMAQDYPNDNGEWVLLTFDPSDSKVDRYRIYREITVAPAIIVEATDTTAADTTEAVKEYISWAVVSAYDPATVGATYIRALVATLGDAAPANYKVAAEAGGETSSSPNAVLGRKVSDAPVVAAPAVGKMDARASVRRSALTNAATAAAIDNIPPAAITTLLAFDTPDDAGGTITVGWNLSSDDRILSSYTWNMQTIYIRGVKAYNIYRRTPGGEFAQVGSVGHGVNTYRDRTAQNNIDYVYDVRAADSSNEVASGLEAVAFAAIDDESVPIGDWTSDGSVGLNDFSRFVTAYGQPAPTASRNAIFDLNGDGVINLGDFSIFAAHYGETTGGAAKAVPVAFGENTDASLTLSAAEKDGRYTIRVSLDKVAEAKTYGFVLKYDVHAFEFEQAVPEGASIVPFLAMPTKPGEVHIAHAYKGDAEVAEISLKVKDEFGGSVRISEAYVWDQYHRTNTVDLGAAATKLLPKAFALKQNYPNPFNPTTVIQYALPEASNVRLEIYNTLGQVVRALVDEKQAAGAYRITWDGRNEYGQEMATGVYIYRIVAGEFHATKRMLLIK